MDKLYSCQTGIFICVELLLSGLTRMIGPVVVAGIIFPISSIQVGGNQG